MGDVTAGATCPFFLRAIADWVATDASCMSFAANQVIKINSADGDWLFGETESGQKGFVPRNYFDLTCFAIPFGAEFALPPPPADFLPPPPLDFLPPPVFDTPEPSGASQDGPTFLPPPTNTFRRSTVDDRRPTVEERRPTVDDRRGTVESDSRPRTNSVREKQTENDESRARSSSYMAMPTSKADNDNVAMRRISSGALPPGLTRQASRGTIGGGQSDSEEDEIIVEEEIIEVFGRAPTADKTGEKSGFLNKKEKSMVSHQWKRWWMVLKDDTLSFYKSSKDPAAGAINITGARTNVAMDYTKRPYVFYLTTDKGTWMMQAPSDPEMTRWMEAITAAGDIAAAAVKAKEAAKQKARPQKGKDKDAPPAARVFGENLSDLIATYPPLSDDSDAALEAHYVPICLQRMVTYLEQHALEVDGIFRIPGNATSIQSLKAHLCDNEEYDFIKNPLYDDPAVVSGVFKLFFRELPEPLLQFSLYEYWIGVNNYDHNARLSAMYSYVHSLPAPNFYTLNHLLKLLLKVADHKDKNRMGLPNLTIVFAPNLLRPAVDSPDTLLHMNSQNLVVNTLLEYRTYFFPAGAKPTCLTSGTASTSTA